MRIVHKYGGSSVATISQIKEIAKNLKILYDKGDEIVVVASAMGKTTNALLSDVDLVSSLPTKREVDFLLVTGEMKTVSLLALALNDIGCRAICLTGFQAGIKTNEVFGKAFIENVDCKRIEEELKQRKIVVVAGFQGISKNGELTTLGRGGSDITAVALAAALKCPCEIYTDVDAVYKVDPRLFAKSKKFKKINCDEMMDMAISGAKVLDVRSVEIAKKYGVKLYLGKTNEKIKRGTYVMNDIEDYFEKVSIKSLSVADNICCFKICGADNKLNEILKILFDEQINLDMIALEGFDKKEMISFCIKENQKNIIKQKINFKKCDFEMLENKTKISLIGYGIATHIGLSKSVFELLKNSKINVYKIASSETVLSFLIDEKNKQKCVEILAEKFNL